MADYKDCICIACRNKFEPNDDIVVCPDCGTPYHRDCWQENGRCINDELHAKGGSWKNPNEDKPSSEDAAQVTCDSCGQMNNAKNMFCTRCGKALGNQNTENMSGENSGNWQTAFFSIFDGSANAEGSGTDMDGVSVQEAADFVGNNVQYYIPRFRLFHDKKILPNFICLFFPHLWFAYRKMWVFALLIVLISFILDIPSTLITLAYQSDSILAAVQPSLAMMGEEMADYIRSNMLSFSELIDSHYNVLYWVEFVCSYLNLAMRILLFLFGNFMYYKFAIKKIKAIRSDSRSLIDVQSRIRMAGGTNIGLLFLMLLVQLVLSSVIIYLILFI